MLIASCEPPTWTWPQPTPALTAGSRSEQRRTKWAWPILAALERNAAIGEALLFPAPLRPGKPWTRHHAKDVLERAEEAARKAALKREDTEAAAMLAPLEGSDFHAHRRAWATARKHLPLKGVAEAGGWRSTDTLLRCYTQADEATMLAVVSETWKVRAIGAKP